MLRTRAEPASGWEAALPADRFETGTKATQDDQDPLLHPGGKFFMTK
jgi:hypothetical protein